MVLWIIITLTKSDQFDNDDNRPAQKRMVKLCSDHSLRGLSLMDGPIKDTSYSHVSYEIEMQPRSAGIGMRHEAGIGQGMEQVGGLGVGKPQNAPASLLARYCFCFH